MTAIARDRRWPEWLSELVTSLNTTHHRLALRIFLAITLAHWAEHVVQAFQIWGLDRPVPESRGVLGAWIPWLVTSEALHYGYALIMLAGLLLLRPGFVGPARTWWTVALGIQIWHHFEHLLLLAQAGSGAHLHGHGGSEPSSVLQMLFPRVELHLFYNAVVFIPMVVAMYLHSRPAPADGPHARCTCAPAPAAASAPA
jgi:hypothetical protein